MNAKRQAYLELHAAVALFGFTAILGDLIALPAYMIVWWRVLLTSFSYIFLIKLSKTLRNLSNAQIIRFLGIGVLVGLHWICFYGSIKYANASVALVCMATTSIFTSFLEPLIMKQPYSRLNIFMGLLIVPGMMLIVDNLAAEMMLGMWIGLLAAFLASSFASLNKRYINDSDPLTISFLEISGAWIFLTICLPIYFYSSTEKQFIPNSNIDWIYILILVLICTTLAYNLALKSLQHLSAFASNLVFNLEPVYGIFLAIILLKEHKELNQQFYFGVCVILAIVISYPFLRSKFSHETKS